LVYRREAEADVRAAFDWYERQREGLGEEFLAELAKAEVVARANPLAYRIIRRGTVFPTSRLTLGGGGNPLRDRVES
jgi:hypothetical protein